MSIHVALNHVTHYRYDRLVSLSPQVVRLRPAPHCRTRILSYSLKVQPADHFINWQQDPEANYLARLVFHGRTREFRIEVDLVAEMSVLNPFDFFLAPYAEEFPFEYDSDEHRELLPYLVKSPATSLIAGYLAGISRERCRTIDFVVGINQRLAADIRYLIRLEPGVQSPEETLAKRSGSCRDSAALLVQLLRHLGLAARFVSGYLIQLVPDVKALDGPVGAKEDFTDLHAWCEVYLPGAGWIGLDPTSGLLAGEGHIPLACTPEPSAAAPVAGEVDECETTFEHRMSVTRVWEAPRVTKPYSEAQWLSIESLGRAVDAQLDAQDVRLTMGGEPTFVSMDHRDGAEWNTAALGPEKRRLAAELYHRLKQRYAPLGLAHFGQGKWYPGEQLPRWSLNCYWRKDGEPVWANPLLVAYENAAGSATEETARRFLARVATQLGLDAKFVFPAYEDAFYYLWRERRLPANVDALDSRLEDPLERARLVKVFEQGLGEVIGNVLPIAHSDKEQGDQWQSGSWYLRSERCYLVPGDSPIGYRLPLASQPWVAAGDYPFIHAPDPSRSFPALAPLAEIRRQFHERGAAPAQPAPANEHPPPPKKSAADPRLKNFRVTPDPGVIEVNIHPSAGWDELSERTMFLYDAARETRLMSEKFMLDGRHTGTGGGNHIVMGGASAPDSPFLRRPDLLRSLLSYWHNHPSLSYLFSGLFIGPTSQAPRVDEARNDSLYELEIAFRQFPVPGVPKPGESAAPWVVDRLLRNLLIDVLGNTHRSEFCIDKGRDCGNVPGRVRPAGRLVRAAFRIQISEIR